MWTCLLRCCGTIQQSMNVFRIWSLSIWARSRRTLSNEIETVSIVI